MKSIFLYCTLLWIFEISLSAMADSSARALCQTYVETLANSTTLGGNERNMVAAIVKHLVPPGTTVFRGLKLPKSAQKKTLRTVLTDPAYRPTRTSDHWSLSEKVAKDFGVGAFVRPDGTKGSLDDTVHLIIEAEADSTLVDIPEMYKIITGNGISVGSGRKSYFDLSDANVGASQNEKEVPIRKSAYPSLKLKAYWVKSPQGVWIRYTPQDRPGAFQ